MRLDYDVLEAWNTAHTDQSIVLARHKADWPMIDSWETPSFYLLHDGQEVAQFSGWPREGNWSQLHALLAKRHAGGSEPVVTQHPDVGKRSSTD